MNVKLLVSLSIIALGFHNSLPAWSEPALAESSSKAKTEAEVGQKSPNFTLPNAQGKSESLNDYAGKFVVLEWVNFGCPFVRKHYDGNNMQRLQDTYTKKGAVWLSICSSSEGKQGNMSPSDINTKLKEKNAHPSSYLIDANGKVGKLYGAKTTPHMYVIDPNGILIYKGAIDDKPSVDPGDIGGAKNYVKSALDEAMAGQKVTTSQTKAYGCSVKYQQ